MTIKNDSSGSARIGYVVKRYPRYSETFIVNEILAHESDGLDIEIFALGFPAETHFQNVISQVRAPVNYLSSGSVKSSQFWKSCHKLVDRFPRLWPTLAKAKFATVHEAFHAIQLAEQVREKRITHLHAHFATSATTVARLAASIAEISYSVTMHAKDIFHESVVHKALAGKVSDAKFVVTVSDFNRRYLIEKFANEDKIHRIYNGLDLDLFAFREFGQRNRKIISVGRLVAKKGFCHLVDACKILDDQGVAFDCEIIGAGELESELRDQIDALSLNRKVVLTGPLPQNIVREKIAAASVFAAPCIIGPDGNRDGLPTVITESLSLGTPVVSTDVTGIPEIVRHEQTGIIVPQGDSNQLAVQLLRLLESPDLCRSLATNARSLVQDQFDATKNVRELQRLFQQADSQTTPAIKSLKPQTQGV